MTVMLGQFLTYLVYISVLRLKSTEKDKNGRFVIHTLQLKPRLACKTLEVNRIISVTSQSETVQPFSVQVRIFNTQACVKLRA